MTTDGQVYHPEMIDDETQGRAEGIDKMDCCIDPCRLCGPSCMAYITFPRGDPKELSNQQAHCAFLLFGERIARHLAILTSTLVSSEKHKKTSEQDRRREKASEAASSTSSPFPTRTKP